jgi:GTP-binding protein
MKITSAEFLKSAFAEKDWPHDPLPEIAFLGRSNVGKSSLINSLLKMRGLARTSNTPGRTQALNFFLINKSFRFVDVPGYGYAKISRVIRESWAEMVTNYLANRRELVLSIQIVDSRHEPTNQDVQLHEWLQHNAKPQIIVATKSDKLSQNVLRQNLKRAKETLPEGTIIAYSAVNGRGRDEVWNCIETALEREFTNLNGKEQLSAVLHG